MLSKLSVRTVVAALAVTGLLAAALLPGGLGLLVGIVAGAVVGVALDRWAS